MFLTHSWYCGSEKNRSSKIQHISLSSSPRLFCFPPGSSCPGWAPASPLAMATSGIAGGNSLHQPFSSRYLSPSWMWVVNIPSYYSVILFQVMNKECAILCNDVLAPLTGGEEFDVVPLVDLCSSSILPIISSPAPFIHIL